ncbi:MAG: hypothetical protein ACKOQ3_14490 [Novosphingobium sp.]
MESFSFGRTLSRTFGLVRDGLPTVGVFMLIIQIVSTASSFVLQGQIAGEFQQQAAAGLVEPTAMFSSLWYWLTIIVGLVLGVIVYTGSIHGFLAVERKAPVSIGECFAFGFSTFLPGLGLLILWILGVGLGWILLIVPGLILITMWSASLPALVAEGQGVIASFGRSRALTKGYRWTIFGTLIVALIIIYIPMVLFGGAMLGASTTLLSGQALSPLFYLFSAAYGWVVGMFLNALLASIYLDCRLAKEGVTSGDLTDVFA